MSRTVQLAFSTNRGTSGNHKRLAQVGASIEALPWAGASIEAKRYLVKYRSASLRQEQEVFLEVYLIKSATRYEVMFLEVYLSLLMAIRRRYADVWPFVAVTVTQYECTLDALVATKTERPDALFVAVVFNRNQPSTALQNKKSIISLDFFMVHCDACVRMHQPQKMQWTTSNDFWGLDQGCGGRKLTENSRMTAKRTLAVTSNVNFLQ